jgi:hypothetical protein
VGASGAPEYSTFLPDVVREDFDNHKFASVYLPFIDEPALTESGQTILTTRDGELIGTRPGQVIRLP